MRASVDGALIPCGFPTTLIDTWCEVNVYVRVVSIDHSRTGGAIRDLTTIVTASASEVQVTERTCGLV